MSQFMIFVDMASLMLAAGACYCCRHFYAYHFIQGFDAVLSKMSAAGSSSIELDMNLAPKSNKASVQSKSEHFERSGISYIILYCTISDVEASSLEWNG